MSIATTAAAADSSKSQYLADFARMPQNGRAAWLEQIRATGLADFQQTPFPTTRMEEWRQTNISGIISKPFRSLVGAPQHGLKRAEIEHLFYGAGAWNELVFVDGYFAADLSVLPGLPQGARAASLAEAAKDPGLAAVADHLGRHGELRSAFTAVNAAFLQDGLFLHIPRNVALEHPVHCIFLSRRDEADLCAHIRNLIVLEQGSQASLVTSYVHLGESPRYLNNVVEEISLAPNSQLHCYKLVEEAPAGSHLATTEVDQQRDSRLHSFVMSMTGETVRNQICVKLDGEGASCNLVGLYLNDGDRLIDNPLSITHVKSNCYSRIMYKGILDGGSQAVYAGKVFVHREAQKTDSNQLNQNLMLSDAATIHAKPQLEIYADDVKCTHGTTIGSPPAPIVFYFRSRGIDEAKARAMLTYGFAEEVVSEIEVPALSERLGSYVYEKYSP